MWQQVGRSKKLGTLKVLRVAGVDHKRTVEELEEARQRRMARWSHGLALWKRGLRLLALERPTLWRVAQVHACMPDIPERQLHVVEWYKSLLDYSPRAVVELASGAIHGPSTISPRPPRKQGREMHGARAFYFPYGPHKLSHQPVLEDDSCTAPSWAPRSHRPAPSRPRPASAPTTTRDSTAQRGGYTGHSGGYRLREDAGGRKGAVLATTLKLDRSSGRPVSELLRETLVASDVMVRVIDLFREWDENQDGRISKHEFSVGMAALGIDVSKEEANELFVEFDPDGSGTIEYKELNQLLKRRVEVGELGADGERKKGASAQSTLAETASRAARAAKRYRGVRGGSTDGSPLLAAFMSNGTFAPAAYPKPPCIRNPDGGMWSADFSWARGVPVGFQNAMPGGTNAAGPQVIGDLRDHHEFHKAPAQQPLRLTLSLGAAAPVHAATPTAAEAAKSPRSAPVYKGSPQKAAHSLIQKALREANLDGRPAMPFGQRTTTYLDIEAAWPTPPPNRYNPPIGHHERRARVSDFGAGGGVVKRTAATNSTGTDINIGPGTYRPNYPADKRTPRATIIGASVPAAIEDHVKNLGPGAYDLPAPDQTPGARVPPAYSFSSAPTGRGVTGLGGTGPSQGLMVWTTLVPKLVKAGVLDDPKAVSALDRARAKAQQEQKKELELTATVKHAIRKDAPQATKALYNMVRMDVVAGEGAADSFVIDQIRNALKASWTRVKDLFVEWDQDGSGTVDQREFHRALALLGVSATREQADGLFATFDRDGSGSVTYAEMQRKLDFRRSGQASAGASAPSV